ncbi:TRAP transporter small permease [Martelella sp. HB161492]|uniref:TRAP transporter small permease n=1 Tax=Martelella sp. HB161492 TaxID=2720726 RepID=UPI001590479D|nr:TRAP transporter small permease [Martelella sp. HB161492]
MRIIRRILDGIVASAMAILLSAMVAVLAWQVFSRYVLNAPSTFSEEFLRFGVIWLSLLGAAFSTGRGTHMAIDLLTEMAHGRTKAALMALVPVSFIIFSVLVLIIGGMRGVNIAAHQTSPVLGVPMGLIYASLPVSGVLMLIYSLLNLVDLMTGKRSLPDTIDRAVTAGD